MAFNRTFAYLISLLFGISSCFSQSGNLNKEILHGDDSANHYNYAGAIIHYQKFITINSQSGIFRNYTRESEVLRKMAYAYSMQGDFIAALHKFKNAADVDSSQHDALNLLEDIRGAGNCYLYMGDYKKGFAELLKCLSLSNKYESGLKQIKKLMAANVYFSISNGYSLLSRFDSCDYYINKAVTVFRNEGDDYGLMISLLKSGMNKVDLCDYKNGIELINQSMDIARKLKLNISEHLQALGDLYTFRGDYESALDFIRRSMVQADSVGNISQLIVCNISLGDLYTEVGDAKTALTYYNHANKIIVKDSVVIKGSSAVIAARKGEYAKSLNFYDVSGASVSKAITLLKIGVSYFERKNYDSCLYYLSKSDELISGNVKNDTKAKLNIYKAASLIESGNYDNVSNIIDSALLLNQNPENEWKILYYSGRLSEHNYDFDEAEKTYRKAIDIIEDIRSRIQSDELKSSFMDKRIEVYDRLIRLLNQEGKAEESFNYSEKARNRAFLDLLARQKGGIAYNNSDSVLALEDQKLKMKMLKLKDKINNYALNEENRNDSISQTRSILESEFLETTNDYEKYVDKLRSKNSKLVQLIRPVAADVNSVISQTSTNTVLIEYWLSAENLYIWTVSKSGVHLATVPLDVNKNQLLKESLEYFGGIYQRGPYFLSELYKILIAPVRNDLKENSNLIIVPHGLLHFVPFQALLDKDSISMVDHYFISYAPSASILKETEKNQHPRGNSLLAMAIGNISVLGMSALESTIPEVKNIAPLFQNSLLHIENECTVDNFTANAPNFSYIHLATHGIYDSNSPFSSFILFNKTKNNEGKLKVCDIFGLRLNANLVTLSACETGLGKISNSDELVGLSRAFIYAGTPAIVVSLWSVADDPTSKLMIYFYEYLKTNPTNVALTLAQRKLKLDYPEPFYWAPFVLIGSKE